MYCNGTNFDTYLKDYPDEKGYFGPYGGIYVSPERKAAMEEIADAYYTICKSRKFIAELRRIRKEFRGRPPPSLTWSASPPPWGTSSFTPSGRI